MHIFYYSLKVKTNLMNTKDIDDDLISAEIPHPILYSRLHYAITTFMIHGCPCGFSNLKSPCMKGTKCSKFFPKKFVSNTTIEEDGYPCYKRQD